MIQINAVITGTRPILFHNPAAMGKPANAKTKDKVPSPEAEASSGCYLNHDKSSLAFPAANLHRAIIIASRAYRDKRRSVTPYISGSIEVQPEELLFGTANYEIFGCRVKVQRQGVWRSRPMLREWRLGFHLLVDDQDVPPAVVNSLLPMIEEAGRRIGIGDFRLELGGKFGKFKGKG